MAEHQARIKPQHHQKKKKKRIPSFNEITFADVDDDEESPSSPLRFLSPLRSDEPESGEITTTTTASHKQSPLVRAIAPIRSKRRNFTQSYPSQRTLRPQRSQRSPLSGPTKPSAKFAEAEDDDDAVPKVTFPEPESRPLSPEPSPLPVVVVVAKNQEIVDVDDVAGLGKEGVVGGGGTGGSSRVGPGGGGGRGGERKGEEEVGEIVVGRRGGGGERKVGVVRRVGLGVRVLEVVVCVVSFSVMATDRTEGWSGDSYDRYKEYRYIYGLLTCSLFDLFTWSKVDMI